jgi:putative cell wall-binding protein
MRKLKSIITILAISLSTIYAVNATEVNPSKTKELRTEIVSILGSKISIELNKPSTAEISFIINNQNEIVIISVDSDIDELNAIIKRKLNYKKVQVRGTKKGEIYKIPLRINTK